MFFFLIEIPLIRPFNLLDTRLCRRVEHSDSATWAFGGAQVELRGGDRGDEGFGSRFALGKGLTLGGGLV